MQKAEAVWVTEDSVSMIYEALSAGCKVGVIPMDRLKADRIVKSVDTLLDQRIVSAQFNLNELTDAVTFEEASSVAQKLLEVDNKDK